MTPTQDELLFKMFEMLKPLPEGKYEVENFSAQLAGILEGHSTEDIAAVGFTIAAVALMNIGNLRIDLMEEFYALRP